MGELFDELLSYEGEVEYRNGTFVGLNPQKPLMIKFVDSPHIILKDITLENELGEVIVIEVQGEKVRVYKTKK